MNTGGDALGAERGRAGRRAMLQHMCVGALSAVLLNNAAASAVVQLLSRPLPPPDSARSQPESASLPAAPATGWQMLGLVTAQLAR